ncbi:hypothetical protein [Micromonospora sp. NPDC005305]|uniref:hypothetical protein n=1 Tax=Micromonospora sp. NPDC005305 TaxID=3156875 RepID=UPI0033B597B0
MPRDYRRPPSSAPDLPTPPPVARPDARVARALAEIVAESEHGHRRNLIRPTA